MRRADHVAWQQVGDETVLVDLEGRVALGLNAVGGLLWPLLDDHAEEELAAALVSRFAIEPGRAREDVRAFLTDLRVRGLVVDG